MLYWDCFYIEEQESLGFLLHKVSLVTAAIHNKSSVIYSLRYPHFSSVQFSHSVMSDWLPPPWTAAHWASLFITNSWGLLKLMSIESVMPPNQLILCHLFLLLPSVFPSIRVFSNESYLIRWPISLELWHQSFQCIFRVDFFYD